MKTKFLQPGRHHWLNWPATLTIALAGYGLFQVAQSCAALIALRAKIMFDATWPAYAAIIALTLLVGCVVRQTLRYQDDTIVTPFKWSKAINVTVSGVVSIILLVITSQLILQHIAHIVQRPSDNQQGLNALLMHGGALTMLMVLTIVLMSPLIEELVFRYLLIGPTASSKRRHWLYAVIAGLLFVYLHVSGEVTAASYFGFHNAAANWAMISNCVSYGMITIVLTTVYMRTHNIAYSMSVHVAWNVVTMAIQLMNMR